MSRRAPARAPRRAWTVLVYLAGDNSLDAAGVADLAEMKAAGSTADVAVVAEFDRGGGKGARRYALRRGTALAADVVADLGRLNTGDPRNLLDFVRWGIGAYPAERYALVLWNHGQGWDDTDIYADERLRRLRPLARGRVRRALFRPPVRRLLHDAVRKFRSRAILLDDDARDFLDNGEMKTVVTQAAQVAGHKLDLLGMDACLMAMAEVAFQVRDGAACAVGSEQTEPGGGWPYDRILRALAARPAMDGRALAATVVREYLASYGAADGVTQSACDLARAGALAEAVAALAAALTGALGDPALRQRVFAARGRVQSYEVADNVDLGDLCALLAAAAPRTDLAAAAAGVLRVLAGEGGDAGFVLAQGAKGSALRASRGLAIYFPTRAVSPLYARLDWARATGWGRFLAAYVRARRAR